MFDWSCRHQPCPESFLIAVGFLGWPSQPPCHGAQLQYRPGAARADHSSPQELPHCSTSAASKIFNLHLPPEAITRWWQKNSWRIEAFSCSGHGHCWGLTHGWALGVSPSAPPRAQGRLGGGGGGRRRGDPLLRRGMWSTSVGAPSRRLGSMSVSQRVHWLGFEPRLFLQQQTCAHESDPPSPQSPSIPSFTYLWPKWFCRCCFFRFRKDLNRL